jgi:deoxyribonuclease V
MRIINLHGWHMDYVAARALQTDLAWRICRAGGIERPRTVAGLDCAFSRDKQRIVAAVVVQSLPDLRVIRTVKAVRPVTFPYIPGLLSFREAPVCLAALEKLDLEPDVFLVDGQGIAHPRRLGLAAHLGLFLERPTIGCAKSRLIGTYKEPGRQKGQHAWLYDGNEIIGAVLRTRTDVRCLFISIGHRCDLLAAIRTVLQCTTRYRLPEPTRLAHQAVTRWRQDI